MNLMVCRKSDSDQYCKTLQKTTMPADESQEGRTNCDAGSMAITLTIKSSITKYTIIFHL
jgi:hypothetical protein